jgi:hypothetical protein
MTALRSGFFIEYLALTGAGKTSAELTFKDGLNVVSGASDTGKSYAFNCVDFAFGARNAPRMIPEALGYDAVILRIRSRADHSVLEFTRTFVGSGVRVRILSPTGSIEDERVVAARHDPQSRDTLSALLLELSGLQGRQVRKNKRGETRTLSFRDIAFLSMVDEERIIADRPPQVSGIPTERTAELDVFRLLATGSNTGEIILAPKKREAGDTKVKLELIRQLIAQVNDEIQRLGIAEVELDAELAQIEEARASALAEYEGSRVELVASERQLAKVIRQLRDTEGRASVVEGLTRRFELLARYYDSDLSRLEAIEEAGTLLESFPATACPVCGAAPSEHRTHEADEHFRHADVRLAAQKEAAKILALRTDLAQVISDLSAEYRQLEARREKLREEARTLQSRVDQDLQPRMHASADALQGQVARRDQLLRARTLVEQRTDLEKRAQQLEGAAKRSKSSAPMEASLSTAEMDAFARTVETLLRAWEFPLTARVVFSENDQDIVIDGQPRTSHGKGVRALTCAAFIAGLMRHCLEKELPHPGLVLLDSPLVVYREPDVEGQMLRQAGVKEAFYRSLSEGLAIGQVIVFENEDPQSDLPICHHHFSKSSSGRYGFVPV